MIVYLLEESYCLGHFEVLSIHLTRDGAEEKKKRLMETNDSYTSYTITEKEVLD